MEPSTAQLDATQQHHEYFKLSSGKGQGVVLMTRSTFLLGGTAGEGWGHPTGKVQTSLFLLSVRSSHCWAASPGHWAPELAISPLGSFILASGSCVCFCSLGLVMLCYLLSQSKFLILVSWSAQMTPCLRAWPSYGKEFLILWILRPVLLHFSLVCLDFIPIAAAFALVAGSHPQTWLQLIFNHWLHLSAFGCNIKVWKHTTSLQQDIPKQLPDLAIKTERAQMHKEAASLSTLKYNQVHWIKAPGLGHCKLVMSAYQGSQQISVAKGQEPISGKLKNESFIYLNSSICTFTAIPSVFRKWKIISIWAELQTEPVQGFHIACGCSWEQRPFHLSSSQTWPFPLL